MKAIIKLALLLMLALSSCRSTRTVYVPVESVRTDSVVTVKLRTDTLMQRDSVYVLVRGDTVRIERFNTLYKVRELRDTLYIERCDSIAVPYPVEKDLSRWQQIKCDTGGITLFICLVCLVIAVVWLARRFRR